MKANNLGIRAAAIQAAALLFSAFNPRDNRDQNYKDRLIARQARKIRHSYGGYPPHSSPREEARRRQQMAYDAGLARRRAIPRSY